jgi:hypothetical protein
MMRLPLILAVAGFLLGATAPQEVTEKQQRYDMGKRICAMVLDDELKPIDGAKYRGEVDAANWERAEYCHCVGEEFADDPKDRFGLMTATGDAEAKAMLAKIEDALQSCLPGAGNNADLATNDDPYDSDAMLPDYVPADTRLKIDEGDRHMCQMFLDDAPLIPGLTSETVNKRLMRTGQSAADLCTCSARKIAAKAKQLEKEIASAANPSIIYSSTLGGAINTCLQ